MLNDYGEWRMGFAHRKTFDITEFQNKEGQIPDFPFGINLEKFIYTDIICKLINDEFKLAAEEGYETTENYEWDDILTHVKYRAPTEEEMKNDGNSIEDYKIGEFIYNCDYSSNEPKEELIKLEEFEKSLKVASSENAVKLLVLIVLKSLRKNTDILYNNTTRDVFI